MIKQYSFILTEQDLSEGKRLRKIALGLGLLGSTVGLSSAPLPNSYKISHPEYGNTFGSRVAYEIVRPKKPVNFSTNLRKGIDAGIDSFMPQEIVRADKVGTGLVDAAKHKGHNTFGSSFSNGFIIGNTIGE